MLLDFFPMLQQRGAECSPIGERDMRLRRNYDIDGTEAARVVAKRLAHTPFDAVAHYRSARDAARYHHP